MNLEELLIPIARKLELIFTPMKYIKILTSIVFTIIILFIIADYSGRNEGTSIFFKGKDFPYGVHPKVYGDGTHLFITKENYILTGDNQYFISDNDTCFIKNLERFAHSKSELLIQFRDNENHARFMRLFSTNDSLFFGKSNYAEFFDNSLQKDYFGYNLFIMRFLIVLFYLAYMLPIILAFRYNRIKYYLILCVINLSLFIYSDFKLGEFGGPYNVILFHKENPLFLFSPGAFLTPEDWDKFLDSNDREKYYEISSSINKANKCIVLQKFQNNTIITIKKNYDETEEIINRGTAISLMRNTKTLWGDTYKSRHIFLRVIRLFSIIFTAYCMLRCFIFCFMKSQKS